MTTTNTARLAGQEAARTANRTGRRSFVGTRTAKRSERNAVRQLVAAEIAALKLVTVR